MTESQGPDKESAAVSVMTVRNEPRRFDMALSARSITPVSIRDKFGQITEGRFEVAVFDANI